MTLPSINLICIKVKVHHMPDSYLTELIIESGNKTLWADIVATANILCFLLPPGSHSLQMFVIAQGFPAALQVFPVLYRTVYFVCADRGCADAAQSTCCLNLTPCYYSLFSLFWILLEHVSQLALNIFRCSGLTHSLSS